MIHEFDTCEDLKIWYDDFLTLGEKYDEEIDYHLKKSDIFVLVVTPSLLEESNYVMEIEYPRAISLKKRIIPIELIPTDKEMLLRKYPQLPQCINVRDVQTLENVFMEAKKELKFKSCPVSDERDYLLGQAYFKGISVELNRERGIVLMTKAAENGHIKAIYQLAAIYYEGKGLEKNLPEAQRWLEKDVELCRKGFEEDALKWGNTLAISMLNLSDCYYNLNNLVAAKETLTQLVDVTIWLWNEGFMGTGSNPGNVWLRLGMLCMSEDDYNGAIQYYNKAEEFLRYIYQCSETTQSTKSYALILGEQGEVYYQLFCKARNVSCLYKAIHYFEKAKQIQERYIEVYKQNDGIQNLTSIYTNLSNAYCNLNAIEQNPDEMLVYLEKAREHFWHVYMQKQISLVERLDSLYLYATYTNTVGFLRESQGEIEYARRLYAEAYNIYKDMCEQRGDEEHYFGLATASIQLAVAGMEIPDKELLMEAYTILKMLCQKYPENKEYIKYLNSTLSRIQSWPKNLG